ncbi:MAG: alpha/beta fold hydrolase [Myxococcota bacterium]
MDWHAPSEGESVASTPADAPEGVLRYRVWAPSGEPRATLAVLSGVMSNTAWFRPLAERWCAMGYRVIGAERRGSGLNVEQGKGDTESAQQLLDDAQRVVEHGRAEGAPLVIVGWCWGAILGTHLALAMGDAVAGVALLTPGHIPSAALAERMKALAIEGKGQPEHEAVLQSPITDEMFTDGPAIDGFIRRDEARWRTFSPRFLAVSTKLSFAARMRLRRLKPPVFVALAEDDVTTDNDAMIAELARLPAERVRTVSLPGAHGLQFDAPDELSKRLDAWARDALGV